MRPLGQTLRVLAPLVVASSFVACNLLAPFDTRERPDTEPDGDSDSDVDIDVDSDSDSDWDADWDAEQDAEGDQDSDYEEEADPCEAVVCGEGEVCQHGECVPLDSDGDGDGFAASVDCDDSDPAINPAADDLCNTADDDCNPETPDGTDECLARCCGRPAACRECCRNGQCNGPHNLCERWQCECEDGWTDCAGSCDCGTGHGSLCCDGECVDGTCCEDHECPGGHNLCIGNECDCEPDWADCGTACSCETGAGQICCFESACITGNCCDNDDCPPSQFCEMTSHRCLCSAPYGNCEGICDCRVNSDQMCCDGDCRTTECCDSGDCDRPHNDCNGSTCVCDAGWIDCEAECDCNTGSRDVCCGGTNCERGDCCDSEDCPDGQRCFANRCGPP